LRADARRNRDAVLAAAALVFDEQGVDGSLEEVARRAGVGIGTLYRHFPARDALIMGVYQRELDLLCDGVDELLDQLPPDQALAAWMERFINYVARKRGMAGAIKSMVGADSQIFTEGRTRIRASMVRLVAAAVEAKAVREDADVDDLLRAMGGFCMVTDVPGWRDQASRLVTLLVDGLRYRAPAST
jgi:AcrR family transcriptional regulator